MKVFKKSDFLNDILSHKEHMNYGAIFIYPTDTIYGLGCDARKNALVQRIRRIKMNQNQPMSIIAPSKSWIKKNMVYDKKFDEWLNKLPGPYTLIMERKNTDCVAEDVNSKDNTLGIRMPDNWFAKIVSDWGFPVVSTSLNLHGQKPCTHLDHISDNIKTMVDLAIDDGSLEGRPSTLVDLTQSEPKVIKR
ncbi:threonylcarbamoyl-AMP synthase [Candidatus Woesearchaeota archaeon]|nr:threonylcarbamoyl-AMP synthase [Candidatus Woesearchaeota archaeon]